MYHDLRSEMMEGGRSKPETRFKDPESNISNAKIIADFTKVM